MVAFDGEHALTPLRNYYGDRAGAAPPRRVLDGRTEAEFCVVGGGLAGLTTALALARAGRSVSVIEAEKVGFGASGRNGGFVGPAWSQRLDVLTRKLGAEPAKALYRLSQEGVAIVARNISDLPMPGIDMNRGKLSCARSPSRDAFIARQERLQHEFGQRIEVWSKDRVRAVLRTTRYFEALHYPDDFQINPLVYARGLAQEIERLGGRIFEQSRVVGIDSVPGARIVRGELGAIKADQVVLASGGYTEGWAKPLSGSYVPISTYVMLTEACPELIATAIQTRFGVGDQRRAGDYYRLVEDGKRLLWGGRITTRVSEPRRLAEMLRATMVATYPQLKDLEVDHAWSGLMAYARHLMPQIGPVRDGVWSCTAFGGHGLNTTAIGGTVVAEALLGQSDRWRLFAPFGFAWTGGPAGRVAVQATYWWLQWRDALAEVRKQAADTGA